MRRSEMTSNTRRHPWRYLEEQAGEALYQTVEQVRRFAKARGGSATDAAELRRVLSGMGTDDTCLSHDHSLTF